MKHKKVTRQALITSITSLILCCSMLVGTTFAWFSDSVSSANNIIKAGNLDVELEYSADMTNWAQLTDQSNVFGDHLWEPGYTQVVYLKIANLGTLALNYQLTINIVSETTGVNTKNETFKLSDSIRFGVISNVTTPFADRNAARSAVTNSKLISAGYAKNSTLSDTNDAEYMALVVWMPENTGNEANTKPGTDTPTIQLGIKLLATQMEYESDSFGDDYDANSYPLITGQLTRAQDSYVYSGQTVSRHYYYYIPSTFTPGTAMPLMLTLHGSGCNAAMQLNEGNWVELAEREGFILIAPEAVAIQPDNTLTADGSYTANGAAHMRWNATSSDPIAVFGVDDVAYLCGLIDRFVSYGYADEDRVFSSGLSHGAFMSIRLAVEAPRKIAGIGSVAGLLATEYANRTLSEQVKLVFVHGTADPVVPIWGMYFDLNGDSIPDEWAKPLDDTISWFLTGYGLSADSTSSSLPDLNTTDQCTITRHEYRTAEGSVPVVKYVVTNGGHTWPGGTQYSPLEWVGRLCSDAQASELIWNELKNVSK